MPRSAKRDAQATQARGFSDKRSFVSTKGHDYLYGADMSARRHQVFVRDNGRCYFCGAWYGESWGEAHHLTHRGKGGSDDLENIVWSDSKCHRQHHVRPRFGESTAALEKAD